MSLHDALKKELTQAIDQFEKEEKMLTDKTALLLGGVRDYIENSLSAMELIDYVESTLRKMPYKFFGFLPGVNDIRRTIEKLFQKPEYELKKLLVEENIIMRNENFVLKKQLKSFQTSANQGNSESSDEWKKMMVEKLAGLEKQVNVLGEKNKSMETENKLLQQQLDSAQTENGQLKEDLEQSKQKEAEVSKYYEVVLDENSQLRLEIETLKRQLELINPIGINNDKKAGFLGFYKS